MIEAERERTVIVFVKETKGLERRQ